MVLDSVDNLHNIRGSFIPFTAAFWQRVTLPICCRGLRLLAKRTCACQSASAARNPTLLCHSNPSSRKEFYLKNLALIPQGGRLGKRLLGLFIIIYKFLPTRPHWWILLIQYSWSHYIHPHNFVNTRWHYSHIIQFILIFVNYAGLVMTGRVDAIDNIL